MINVQVDAVAVIAKLGGMSERVRGGVRGVVQEDAFKLLAKVQAKVSGDVLNVRSGNLRRSLHETGLQDNGSAISDSVASDSSVKYARIHEYGGRINIPEIVPRNAKALAFNYGGKMVFAKRVKAHVVNMPERSYMRSSLAEFTPIFVDDIRKVTAEAVA